MLLFVIIGALIGLSIGKIPGLVLGAAAGYGLGVLVLRVFLVRGLGMIQSQFLDSTFSVMGALCKADGQVSSEEIRVVEQFFDRLALSHEQRQSARASFNRGKSSDFDLDAELGKLRSVARNNQALLQLFLQVQLSAIAADGVVHEAEQRMLLRIAQALGLSEIDIERIKAALGAAPGRGARHEQTLDEAYATLGVDPEASDAEVKKAYRRLMSKHHPDKLAGRGMPDSMRPVAEERTREIRSAYDRITEQRGTRRAA